MAFQYDGFILSRLFIVAPELYNDYSMLKLAFDMGLFDERDYRRYRSWVGKFGTIKRLRGKSLIERILILAPELLSTTTVDALRRWNLISTAEGHALRTTLRVVGALLPKGPKDMNTLAQRSVAAANELLSPELISLIRAIDQDHIERNKIIDRQGKARLSHEMALYYEGLIRASIDRAAMFKDIIGIARGLESTISDVRTVNNVWDAVTVVGEGILNPDMLKRAARLGVISEARFDIIMALADLGMNSWRKGLVAARQDSFEARALLISEGILSPEMITALRAAGIIDPKLARWLYPAATAIRGVTRGALSQHMKSTRVRAMPGETPIQAFARVSHATDSAILKLLAEAARDARKEAAVLAASEQFGKMSKASQQRLVERSLHLQMRSLMENVGHMTIFGEKEAARAAVTSMGFLQDRVYGRSGADIRRMLQRQAESGLDSYVSRSSSRKRLSYSVYRNIALATGQVDKEISKGLLRGLNAKDLANNVAKLIDPNVPGGVSYSAMRLSRTEINRAFHETSVRTTIDDPWIDGYKWNLSGSHPTLDVCNTMANDNHDGIGRGVYKKGNVPNKPHPQCLCYITMTMNSKGQFEAQLRRGSYDNYLKKMRKQATEYGDNDYYGYAPESMWSRKFLNTVVQYGAFATGTAAAYGGGAIVKKMAEDGFKNPFTLPSKYRKRTAPLSDAELAALHTGPDGKPLYPAHTGKRGQRDDILDPHGKMMPRGDMAMNDLLDRAVQLGFVKTNDWMEMDAEDYKWFQEHIEFPMEANALYGNTTYRTLNTAARYAKGDPKKFNEMFEDWAELHSLGGWKSYLQVTERELNKGALETMDAIPVMDNLDELVTLGQLDAGKLAAFAEKYGFKYDMATNTVDYNLMKLNEANTMFLTETIEHWSEFGPIHGKQGYQMPWSYDPSKVMDYLHVSGAKTTKPWQFTRISGSEWMGGLDPENPYSAIGRVFTEHGYTATESAPMYYNADYKASSLGVGIGTEFGRGVRYIVQTPKGADMFYGNDDEFEIVAFPGAKYEVMSVLPSQNESFDFDVVVRMLLK
jgi:hypothetical protein